jgi:hypothetical protein
MVTERCTCVLKQSSKGLYALTDAVHIAMLCSISTVFVLRAIDY